MGITAENAAARFEITREKQDEFAALSQQKAEMTQKEDRLPKKLYRLR
jgi:acetyl-CoA C-acetyltransferase